MQKETTFKDVDIAYAAEVSVCFECGLEAGTKYEPSKDQVKPSRFCKAIELIGNQDRVGADSGQSYSQSHGRGMARVAAIVGTKSPSFIPNRIVRRNVKGRIKPDGIILFH